MAENEFSVHGRIFKTVVQEPPAGSSDAIKVSLFFEGKPIWRKTVSEGESDIDVVREAQEYAKSYPA
jgi:hypothetical protein